jgi:hypothetical protein
MIDRIAYVLLLFPLTFQLLYIQQLLPNPTYLSITITSISTILLYERSLRIKRYVIIIGGVFLLYGCLFMFQSYQDFHFGFIIINIFILFIVASKRNIDELVKLYIILAVVVSTLGLISWFLVHANIIHYDSWRYSLMSATEGKIKKDYLFVNPYGLGLVFNKVWYFMGLPYHRASGWSQEPHIASMFSNPALICLLANFKNRVFSNKSINIISIVILLLFMFVSNSLSAQVALILVLAFYSVVNFKIYILTILFAIFAFIVINLSEFTIIAEKFSEDSQSLEAATKFKVLSVTNFISMMTMHSLLYLYNRSAASLVCIYLLLHMLKGGGSTDILITPLYFLFLLISLSTIKFNIIKASHGRISPAI